MTHDHSPHDDQMSALMERAMCSVTASDELVATGLARGRSITRRRRTAQAAGIGSVAALATVAALAPPSFLGGHDDRRAPVASSTDDGDTSTGERLPPTTASDDLPASLRRAQKLLLDAVPRPLPDPGAVARVTYDPDGRGRGEIYLSLTSDHGFDVRGQDTRCDRVAASPRPDSCVDTGDGWVFTSPSLPDISGNDAAAAGVRATYILRDGNIVTLIAYNTPDPVGGGEPTRTDTVLDADELVELASSTDWFA